MLTLTHDSQPHATITTRHDAFSKRERDALGPETPERSDGLQDGHAQDELSPVLHRDLLSFPFTPPDETSQNASSPHRNVSVPPSSDISPSSNSLSSK